MTQEQPQQVNPRDIALEYFRRADAGSADLTDLFEDDIEFYFPKHGVGVGKDAWTAFLDGFASHVRAIAHKTQDFRWHEVGNTVVVEGTTVGQLADGTAWEGGVTPGGRFCSVFDISDGLISRMYIYLDPDYGGHHREQFWWADPSPTQAW